MRILVAIDGSEHSDAVIDEIAHRHSPADSEVRIISVVNPPMPLSAESLATSAGYHGELEKIERELASRSLEKAAARLRDNLDGGSMKITTEVLAGSPKQVILEEAESFGADLIVIGSHGHGALERFIEGTRLHLRRCQASLSISRRPPIAAALGRTVRLALGILMSL